LAAAERAAALAEERRLARSGPTRRYTKDDLAEFSIHVLFELDSLRSSIQGEAHESIRRALGLVLSAILTKVGQRSGDSTEGRREKRIAAGFTTKLFVRKTDELCRRLDAFRERLPEHAPEVHVLEGDARRIDLPRRSIDLVLTSPPYAGVYDYVEHHQTRLRWLGFDARPLVTKEIGSKRRLAPLPERNALRVIYKEMGECLTEIARVLAPRGQVVLLMGDVALGERPLSSLELVRDVGSDVGLELAAWASQPRAHYHAPTRRAFSREARAEHLLLLRPVSRRRA
jgi:hypothetical protein